MNKWFVIIITAMCLSCASTGKEPVNIQNRIIYGNHHKWCMNYGTINKTPLNTMTYRECMEMYGYRYED